MARPFDKLRVNGNRVLIKRQFLSHIGSKTKVDFRVSANELSLAASELSRILVQSERGLETGHLYQALQYLDDQATLAYFPEHLSVHPDKPLPEHIAESVESGRSMAHLLRTFKTEQLERFLKLFNSYEEMKYQLPKVYRVWGGGWVKGKYYEPCKPYVAWSSRRKKLGSGLYEICVDSTALVVVELCILKDNYY